MSDFKFIKGGAGYPNAMVRSLNPEILDQNCGRLLSAIMRTAAKKEPKLAALAGDSRAVIHGGASKVGGLKILPALERMAAQKPSGGKIATAIDNMRSKRPGARYGKPDFPAPKR